jgi:hypothetical protein
MLTSDWISYDILLDDDERKLAIWCVRNHKNGKGSPRERLLGYMEQIRFAKWLSIIKDNEEILKRCIEGMKTLKPDSGDVFTDFVTDVKASELSDDRNLDDALSWRLFVSAGRNVSDRYVQIIRHRGVSYFVGWATSEQVADAYDKSNKKYIITISNLNKSGTFTE